MIICRIPKISNPCARDAIFFMFPHHRDAKNSLEPSINSLAVICKTFNLFEGAELDEGYIGTRKGWKKKSLSTGPVSRQKDDRGSPEFISVLPLSYRSFNYRFILITVCIISSTVVTVFELA